MKSILILEDDANILNNLTELLEAEGYKIHSGSDGTDGVALLKKIKPDLIICDIMMPKMNGHEFYKFVKNDYQTRFIPFIFLTAQTDLVSIREGLSLGADDYITKPFSSADLLQTVEVRLKKQREFSDQLNSLVKNIDMYMPHELRTPLVAIIGYSQLVIADADSMEKSDIKEMTEKILWSAHRLHERIEKFLSFAELNLYNPHFTENENSDVIIITPDYISEIISSHYVLAERNHDFDMNIENASLLISDNHFKKMVKEILENAARYSQVNSKIYINGSVKGKEYILCIKDNGIGIEKKNIENIGTFQQFSREEHSQQGNGLGLAIAKRILQLYNGKLDIESVKEEYTSITITLPVK